MLPHLHKRLENTAIHHLSRERRERLEEAIDFSHNDYLSIATHPAVKKTFIESAERYGLGSTGSPQLSGYTRAHRMLEETAACFLKRDRALLFNSGYHANLGVIQSFASRHSTIIADKHCHASIIDAIVLSRAKYSRYPHNQIDQVNFLLQQSTCPNPLVITESVFSIQGNITDAKTLAHTVKKHNGFLIIDDAHGVGVLGKSGRGIAEYALLSQDGLPCLITPLGKAIGSMGAIVSGSEELIEALLQFARTYRYSTALPPAVCDATRTAFHIVENETWRREQLHARIRFFIQAANERNVPLASSDLTPIKSIPIGSNQKAVELQTTLQQHRFLVSCIRPPTVPPLSAMIRISLNCLHTEADIIQLLDLIKKYMTEDTCQKIT